MGPWVLINEGWYKIGLNLRIWKDCGLVEYIGVVGYVACAMSGHSLFDRKRPEATLRQSVLNGLSLAADRHHPILWRQTCFPQQAAKLPSLLKIAVILAAGEVGGR
jgi:hypothetical protein